MVTLSGIRSRVRIRYEAASSTRWSDADINEAINDGLAELSEVSRYYESWVSVPLKANRTYFDLRGLVPDGCLSVTSVWHEAGNRWLTPTKVADMPFVKWEESAGGPISWFVRGVWWLGLWPRPGTAVDEWVRLYYTGLAPALKEDGEEPKQLPDEMIPALEEYALYELTQREGDGQKALYWYGKYKEREADLEQYMAHRVTRARTGSIGRA